MTEPGTVMSADADGSVRLDDLGPGGTRLVSLSAARDERGALVAAEWPREIPFSPARFFVVYDVPSEHTRGEHAHRECAQFLVCLRGAVAVLVDDGTTRREYRLDSPDVGLHLPPMVWGEQHGHTPGAILFVAASHPYASEDYIRDYSTFLGEARNYLSVRENGA
jgi:hypothetical protein